MSLSRRQMRCMNAIEAVLKQIRKKDFSPELLSGLESRFLSGSGILESSAHMLTAEDLSESEALLLNLIPDLSRLMQRERFGAYPRLDSFPLAGDYLRTLYIGVPIERFYALCLDDSGRLLQCALLQSGNVDETPFYLDVLLQKVIVSGASAVVLSHNHPGGTVRPSKADMNCTLTAIGALHSIGVMLLDHIIIADDQPISLREQGYFRTNVWSGQEPSSALLRGWLKLPD